MMIRFSSNDLRECLERMLGACRLHTGETLREVSERVGVSRTTICNAENGLAPTDTMWRLITEYAMVDEAEVTVSLELKL